MSIVHEFDGSDLVAPTTVQLVDEQTGFGAKAYGCEFDTATAIVDDAGGTLDFQPFRTWRIRETTATAGNRIFWAGFSKGQRASRGAGNRLYPNARSWEIELEECNVFVRRRLLRTGANRPAETVSARIAWLLTTAGFTGGLIVDGGLVEPSSVMMDPVNYTDQYGDDVLNSCAAECGYTPHIRYREATDDYQLIFIDYLTSGADESTFKISNVPADLGTAVAGVYPNGVWPPNDCSLERSPERLCSGISVPFTDGSEYQQLAATQALIGDIDLVAPSADVKTAATARARGLRLLHQQSVQEERITDLTVWLPAANVNDVKQGQLMQAKFSHFPAWEDYRYCRLIHKTVRRSDNLTQAGYEVDMELVPTGEGFGAEASTFILLYGPNDNQTGTNDIPAGTYLVPWDSNGDGVGSTPTGCSLVGQARVGFLNYVGASEEWTGITSTGWGSPSVEAEITVGGSTLRGPHTLTVLLRKNGATVASVQHVTVASGAINWNAVVPITVVPLIPGDVLDLAISITGSPNIMVIPAGTGNCENVLRVSGSMVGML
jgi:hypothetical protein